MNKKYLFLILMMLSLLMSNVIAQETSKPDYNEIKRKLEKQIRESNNSEEKARYQELIALIDNLQELQTINLELKEKFKQMRNLQSSALSALLECKWDKFKEKNKDKMNQFFTPLTIENLDKIDIKLKKIIELINQ